MRLRQGSNNNNRRGDNLTLIPSLVRRGNGEVMKFPSENKQKEVLK
jgi:hypothetical protein